MGQSLSDEEIQKIAEQLGLKVTFKSDKPGVFSSTTGECKDLEEYFSDFDLDGQKEGVKMMRELKFRGKSKETGEWVIGTYIDGFIIRGVIEANSEYIVIENWVPVHDDSVGQYTGLEDAEGNELYEDDIYHMGDHEITYTVVWQDTGFKGKQNSSTSYAGLLSWQDRIEVVGNSYDNPELIK